MCALSLGKKKAPKASETEQPLLPEKSREHLRALFERLKAPVVLEVFTDDAKGFPEYNDFTRKLCRAVAELSDKITIREFGLDSDRAREKEVSSSPTILYSPDRYDVRFLGAPAGEEGRTFVETILLVSQGAGALSPRSRDILSRLAEKRTVKVFVSPTCPYCPGQAMNAFKAAVERPDLVSAWAVETGSNAEMADAYGVGSVPHTVINESLPILGLEPEERFIAELTLLKSAEEMAAPQEARPAPDGPSASEVDLVIIGAGPAGLSAGIYAARSGLSTVVLEKAGVGGQVTLTPVVENYPGLSRVAGVQLTEILTAHAREYVDVREFEAVSEIKVGKRIEVITRRAAYSAEAVIIAAGATWKKLDVPGEDVFFGRGVSYCATCDANLYRKKKAVVVGGGNTALTDALHLRHLGAEVTLVHRRDAFRGEKYLQESIAREQIPVRYNTVVEEILGKNRVAAVRLKNLTDGSVSELATDAVFVAVGQKSNTELAEILGLAMNPDGSIRVDAGQRTSLPRIYAAGDITGGVRQIVTAVGQGATAALTVFEDLTRSGKLSGGGAEPA